MATLARQSIQLENPSIGGRNLLKQTATKLLSSEFAKGGNSYYMEDGFCVSKVTEKWVGYEAKLSKHTPGYPFAVGDTITVSADVRGVGYTNIWAIGSREIGNTIFYPATGDTHFPISSTWERVSATFVMTQANVDWLETEGNYIRMGFENDHDAVDGSYYEFRKMKLEKGTKATDWTPAPEDKADQAIIDNWTSDAIKDGVTKINGGYIQTQTINSSHLIVEDIFATGSAAMNIISARELNADLITSGTINANFLSLYGLKVLNKTTNQETLNITDNGEITLRGSVESYNFNTGKTGWAIKHDGDAEFNDVVVRGSVITNDGGIVSGGGSGRNLLLNSYSDKKNSNTSYPCAIYNLAKKVTAYEKYTFTIRAEFTNSRTMALYFGGRSYGSQWVSIPGDGTHTISFTFTADANKAAQSSVHVYVRDQANSASFTNGSCKIIWAKLEEGTVATAWSPAPEDNLKQVRFWAGASYDEREAAPWIVYNDGSMVATKGTFSGVFSGDIKIGNISITDPSSSTGNDAILTITNGSTGVEAVQLTDRGTSVFRQSVVFRSASAGSTDTTISLEPNGTGIFKSSVQVGSGANVAGLENDKLVIRGHTLTHNSSGLQSNSDFFVGEAAHKKNLKTCGDMYATGVVRTDDMVLFADKAQMKIVANGLNIDVFNS